MLIVSLWPVAISLPLEENATKSIGQSCPSNNVKSSAPGYNSEMKTAPEEPNATRFPSGENALEYVEICGHGSFKGVVHDSTSQMQTTSSVPLDAILLPSRENAIASTHPLCPWKAESIPLRSSLSHLEIMS